MYTPEEVSDLINQGKTMLLAGHESLLQKLPKGNWIGGTTVYFMSEKGGMISENLIQVTEMPSCISEVLFKYYDTSTIKNIYKDAYENGFSVVIIPAFSPIHFESAGSIPLYDDFATKPLVGWIAGVDLAKASVEKAKVFLGTEQTVSDNLAVAVHFKLSDGKFAEASIINIFTQGNGDEIEFSETGLEVKNAIINGKSMNFVDYLINNKIETKFPLVANYNGTMMNVTFRKVNTANKTVSLFAPVFKGVVYKLGHMTGDYIEEIVKQTLKAGNIDYTFSCNCVSNYLGSNLEGKQTGNITGPMTFGEIAYQLLNNTMVNLEVKDL